MMEDATMRNADAEWLADKLHSGGDWCKEAAAALVDMAKAADYYRAGLEQCAPKYVPGAKYFDFGLDSILITG